jgi:glycosyltransferase involved in cell wall biosynthesis
MRFLFVSTMNDAPWGGSEELWSRSALRLAAEGHHVRASVAHWPKPAEKLAELTRRGIEIHDHPSMRDGLGRRIGNKLFLRIPRARARLRRFHPDLVILSQGYNAGGFGWARLCRDLDIPYVLVVHCNSEFWWFGDQRESAAMAYTGAQRVFCVSHKNLELLRWQLGDALPHAEVIRNPSKVTADVATPWPLDRPLYRLACVARLEVAAKGQDLLLQTLARPEWRSRPIELNLYGEGADADALRHMAHRLSLENVHFRGHVHDVSSIWSENHLLALPSRYEGLPLALVEAMRCGRPAVVTDVGGNPELCIDGVTGFVAPAATVTSLSQTLERAWEQRNGWRELGTAARERVDQQIPVDPVGVFLDKLKSLSAPDA